MVAGTRDAKLPSIIVIEHPRDSRLGSITETAFSSRRCVRTPQNVVNHLGLSLSEKRAILTRGPQTLEELQRDEGNGILATPARQSGGDSAKGNDQTARDYDKKCIGSGGNVDSGPDKNAKQ
jgi:predicted Fe-S protein YdhL (DUF1289 family)